MLRTLYAKLAAVLILLVFGIGLFYTVVSTSLIERHRQEANQELHRDLAHNLVNDRNLVHHGQLNTAALEQTFHDYMVINPSIEIYLLDLQGTILSFSADPGKVKRKHVSIAPVQAFLEQQTFPLLGDDPRSHDRQKAFSVTPIPSAENAEGYLYVVLQGEEFDAINDGLRDSAIFRLSVTALVMSLILGALAGLGVFYGLTRRLQILAQRIDTFRESDYSVPPEPLSTDRPSDEIDQLGASFEHMAERIVEQFSALQEKDNQRRELVAQVSHDLRTPLASLHGYLETLSIKQDSLTPEAQREYLNVALRHSERLGKLIGALFELAKLDARESLPNKESFVIAELLQDVAQKYQLRAEQQGLQLMTEFAAEAPFVAGDIGMLERVLENLIENAFAHSESGDRITLSMERREDRVVIGVADTGAGISPDDLPHIFDRFYQGGDDKRRSDSSGLGLAIVKRILTLHDSEINVSSAADHGAQFSFTLPIYER